MGFCQLPSKRDYWSVGKSIEPTHWISENLSRNRFEFVWRNISLDANFATNHWKVSMGCSTTKQKSQDDDSTIASDATGASDVTDDGSQFYDRCDDESESGDSDGDSECFSDNDTISDDSTGEQKKKGKDYCQKFATNGEGKWYEKAAFLVDWLNKFSCTHCKHPVRFSFCLLFTFAFSAADLSLTFSLQFCFTNKLLGIRH